MSMWRYVGISAGFVLSLWVVAGSWGAPTLLVVLDDSGSMRQPMQTVKGPRPKIEVAKQALSGVVRQLPADAQLGIMLLNQNAAANFWLVPLGKLDKPQAFERIRGLRAEGRTPLGIRLKHAADALLEVRQRQIYGDFRLLVITDGEASDPEVLEGYLPDLLSRGFSLDVIGVAMTADHSLAQRAHSYRRAADAASLTQALQEVLAEATEADALTAGATDRLSDFELIADLPEDFAREVLATLAVPVNREIVSDFPGQAQAAGPSPDGSPPNSWPPREYPPGGGATPAGILGGLLSLFPCCMMIVVAFILVVMLAKKKQRKRRR
jgi:hypothetical protein